MFLLKKLRVLDVPLKGKNNSGIYNESSVLKKMLLSFFFKTIALQQYSN